MKKLLWLVLLLCTCCLTVYAAEEIFAFEDLQYSVLLNKSITLKPVAQNIAGTLSYTWSSSDENVATVQNGQVKGKSSGEAVITCSATSKDGNTYTATCVVQVIVPITSIKAEKNSVELAPGSGMYYTGFGKAADTESYNRYKPVLTFSPADATNKTLEWSSENISVATVDANGTIYGRGAGTTRIVGKATDGSGQKDLR